MVQDTWYMRLSYLEELVCEGVDQLQVDGPEAGGGEQLPQHPLRDAAPPAGQALSFNTFFKLQILDPDKQITTFGDTATWC